MKQPVFLTIGHNTMNLQRELGKNMSQ